MSLSDRVERFDQFCANFPCDRPAPLIAVHKIKEPIFGRLWLAVASYLWVCLSEGPLEERVLLEKLEKKRSQIPNCTPNGLIKPYAHVQEQFNRLYECFAELIVSLGVANCAPAFFGLLDVRYKEGVVYEKNIGRGYSTEEIHSDAWSFGRSDCLRMLIPAMGDTSGNTVDFYTPPEHFEERWMNQLSSYRAGEEITKQYRKVEVSVPKGSICFFDFAVLHQTVRSSQAGGRVSLGNTIYSQVPNNERNDAPYSYLTYDDLMAIRKGDKFLRFEPFDKDHFSKEAKYWRLVSK